MLDHGRRARASCEPMTRRPLRTALVLACLLALALGFLSRRSREPGRLDGGDPTLLTDRVWLEGLPESRTEHKHAMLVMADAPYGVFHKGSAYQASYEVFEHSGRGNSLKLTFPQSGKKAEVATRVTACSDRPPFDLCLQLSSNPWGGPTRYYGFRDEAGAGERVVELHHRLAHAAVDGP